MMKGCTSYSLKACNVCEPKGLHVPFNEEKKYAEAPGGLNVLFYDGVKTVQGSTSYSTMAQELARSLQGSTSYCVMACCAPRARGAHVLFYEEMKYAKAPEQRPRRASAS